MRIPYGRQQISAEDIAAVTEVLASDFLTQGPVVTGFEKAVTEYTGARFGVAVNSGTSALHLACLALGLGKGDRLWTSTVTFVASANCALYCGASVDFVDIDPVTSNISISSLKKKLESARKNNTLPKIVIAVHLAGLPCQMQDIFALSQLYGFHIIEDACHALGGQYNQKPVGACQYSDITIFSFHPVKSITTGEGGMAVTNNESLSTKIRSLSSHGITRNPKEMTEKSHGPWYYQQIELGYNYRMSDILAALGISQLNRLNQFVSKRQKLANRYENLLADFPVKLPMICNDQAESGLHLYVIRLQLSEINTSYRKVFQFMRDRGVGVNLHYIPVHTQPWYQSMGFNWGDFPEAENYYHEAMSLPLHPGLSDDHLKEVIEILGEGLEGSAKREL